MSADLHPTMNDKPLNSSKKKDLRLPAPGLAKGCLVFFICGLRAIAVSAQGMGCRRLRLFLRGFTQRKSTHVLIHGLLLSRQSLSSLGLSGFNGAIIGRFVTEFGVASQKYS